MDPNDQRFCGLILEEFEKRRIGNRVHFPDHTSVDGRAGWMMLRDLDVYQAVRSLSRVFAKVRNVPICEGPCFPVGDIADRLVEISANHERADSPLQKPCQSRTEMGRNREVKSCNQSQYVTECRDKNDESGLFSHEANFILRLRSCEAQVTRVDIDPLDASSRRDVPGLDDVCFL